MVEMFKMMTGKTKVDYTQWFRLATVRQGAGNTRANSGYLNVVEPDRANTAVRRFLVPQELYIQLLQKCQLISITRSQIWSYIIGCILKS